MRAPRSLAALLASLLLLVGISTVMAWEMPYGPDEGSHVFVVTHHAHHLEPLTWEDMRYGSQRGHAYFLLSPVAYAPYLPFQWLQEAIGPADGAAKPEFAYIRLGGALVAAAQLALTIAIIRRLLRDATPLQVIALATAANLLPQLRQLHAYVNPDGMTILAGTACFAVALRVLQRARVGLADAALVGITLGFAGLMRLNVAVPAAILAVALGAQLVRQGGAVRERLRFAGVAVALPMLMAGALHLSFYAELDNGEVLPADTVMQMGDSTDSGVVPPSPPRDELVEARLREVPTFWMTTVLWYPRYADLRGPPLQLVALLCAVGAVGLAVPGGRLRTTGRIVGAASIVGFVITWLSIAGQWLYGQQGRFLLPAGMTALAVVITSTATLVDRVPRLRFGIVLTAAAWALLMLSLDAWGISRVLAAPT